MDKREHWLMLLCSCWRLRGNVVRGLRTTRASDPVHPAGCTRLGLSLVSFLKTRPVPHLPKAAEFGHYFGRRVWSPLFCAGNVRAPCVHLSPHSLGVTPVPVSLMSALDGKFLEDRDCVFVSPAPRAVPGIE